ncbi:hypothetical protein ABQX22_06560 [Xanthomonas sp. WHRI 1810A]|uniref:hypothetical protein n=1 Tax=Xanthomonas sp. WHRI 1810A TaxID=3161565 RepID=UPI0032E929AA
MKDSLLLLLAALFMALASWAFWHYLDEDAWLVFVSGMLFLTALDNYRLRRTIKQGKDRCTL